MRRRQKYDSAAKSIFKEEARCILPRILEGAIFVDMAETEVIPMPKRLDRVCFAQFRGKLRVINVEWQAGPDPRIVRRLLAYHGILALDYNLPVISILIFLFRCPLPEPMFKDNEEENEGIKLNFYRLGMWTLDGREYVKDRVICMYPFLPTMGNIDAALLLQSIDEMVEYYQKDEIKLSNCLLWFDTFLQRTDTVTREDKKKVGERLDNLEQLIEENTRVQKIVALKKEQAKQEGEREGLEKGIVKGELLGLRKAVVSVVANRFPDWTVLVQQRVKHIQKPEELETLMTRLLTAPDEASLVNLLRQPDA
ncbi:MAG TPA: hypothetical protein VKR06_45330 [Ktedonosporobacter sp.]|nr:hypothetical protein [Ktedonosporobacter sp.]